MLHAISWKFFIQTMLVLTTGYYLVIILLFYRTEMRGFFKPINRKSLIFILTSTGLLYRFPLRAQTADGNNGLSQANTMVRSYYDTATQLMYAIGAIMGLIGAIRVFSAMNKSERLAGNEIAIWFGACIFLVVVATVIKSFFGL